MKSLTNTALLILIILALPTLVICQISPQTISAKNQPPYQTMNVKFVLEGTLSPEAVGFDNPKSFWQFRYELRFLKERFPFQSFKEIEIESQKERAKRIRKNNKIYDKGWKRYGVLVGKGMIAKTPLLSAENREINIPVNLKPEIMDFLAKAENTWQNPDFRISINAKIFTQENSNLKLKKKIKYSFVCPTKIQTKNAQYWVTNTCGISFEILKKEDGKIVLNWISRI